MNPNFVESTEPWRESIRWKQHELDLIADNYEKMSDEEIQKNLIPYRSVSAVKAKRQEIGCHYKMQKHQIWTPVWSDSEREILFRYGANYTCGQLQKMFFRNKTSNQVAWMRKHLGIFRGKK